MATDAAKVAYATEHGIENAAAAMDAARHAGIGFAPALALLCMESPDAKRGVAGGANIYGHDLGGVFSTAGKVVEVCGKTYLSGANVPVTPANAGIFLGRVFDPRETSNGMGPCQITYAQPLPDGRWGGYFRQMLESDLLPWVPEDNMLFGFRVLKVNHDHAQSWEAAAAAYNGGTRWQDNPRAVAYGAKFARWRGVWRVRFRNL
jgi:hypothetical protein